jgi:thiamine thiazole synthase
MSPPAAIFESPASAVIGNSSDLKKNLAVKAASVGLDGQAKTVADFENNWDNFTFAPIRESQVSRAMSMFPSPRRHFKSTTDMI